MSEFVEIEKKYLINSIPMSLDSFPSKTMRQGYIECKDESVEVRLRQEGDSFVQTIKKGGGSKRLEVNIPISEQQFNVLWPLTQGKRINKKRFFIRQDTYTIELDVYKGLQFDLMTADVEFESTEAADAFTPPDWFGREITSESQYRNRHLAF